MQCPSFGRPRCFESETDYGRYVDCLIREFELILHADLLRRLRPRASGFAQRTRPRALQNIAWFKSWHVESLARHLENATIFVDPNRTGVRLEKCRYCSPAGGILCVVRKTRISPRQYFSCREAGMAPEAFCRPAISDRRELRLSISFNASIAWLGPLRGKNP